MADEILASILASGQRVRLIARHTLRSLLALRLTLLLLLVGAGFCLLTLWLRAFNFGSDELKFIGDFGLGGLAFFGTALAALATAQVFFNELTDGMAACVLTRPVRRTEYLAGQLGGVGALLALFTVALGGLLAALLAWRSAQLGAPPLVWSALLAACGMQWLKFCLVSALTLLVCTYASSALFAGGLGLLLTLLGHWRLAVGGSRWLDWLKIWPDFSRFDDIGWLALDAVPAGWALLGLGGHWLGWMLLLSGLAGYVFHHREF